MLCKRVALIQICPSIEAVASKNDRLHPEGPEELERYLIASEKIVFIIHRHWITLLEPMITAAVGVVVFLAVVARTQGDPGHVIEIFLAIAVLLVLRLLFYMAERHHELFLATDRRLMLVHGLVTRQVDIMPMAKVTDMRYDRTLPGMLFGYGVYILESAGQDQALSEINFVPEPDLHYQQISRIIFAPSSRRLSDKLVPASTGSKIPIGEPEQSWWRRR
jgi:hypothetical protein